MHIYLDHILFFLKPSNEAIEFSTSKLIAPCFIFIKQFIVFLSGSIITLPLVYSFINCAISVNSYAPGVTAKIGETASLMLPSYKN